MLDVGDDDAELAADWLWGLGATAVEFRRVDTLQTLVAGFAGVDEALAARSVLVERWPTRFEQPPAESEWRDVWLRHLTPIRIGDLVVHPPWITPEPDPGLTPISIDPGRAFGSGHHPSTVLAITLLERIVRPGDSVLDAGCGTGVLGIISARLGASRIVAVDLDADILETARSNAQANGVEDLFVFSAEPLDARNAISGALSGALSGGLSESDPAAVTVVNMTMGTLEPLLVGLFAETQRSLIVSGILEHQIATVERAVGQRCDSAIFDEGWAALVFSSHDDSPDAYG